jgi:hypothetical protein
MPVTVRQTTAIAGAAVCAAAFALPATAAAGVFGTRPLEISIAPSAGAPDAPSANPAVSGDNRRGRLAAFDSAATNLVSGDTNGHIDVFLWHRPSGRAGLQLEHPTGGLERVSVNSAGQEANGDSTRPSLDGSVRHNPHCVAFQSTATNLSRSDRDPATDVYVRDLRTRRTTLVSRGVTAPAGAPSIDGSCHKVAFEAGGTVYVARVRGGQPKRIGSGSDPDVSLDGSAVTWVDRGTVRLRRQGRTARVGPGANPTVSDATSRSWGVSFETRAQLARNDHNTSLDVYMRVLRRRGGPVETDLISAEHRGGRSLGGINRNGGITAYAPVRGIVVFSHQEGGETTLYYRNNNSGNIDDLAHAPAIGDIATSARANFVAFESPGGPNFVGANHGTQSVFFKHLVDGEPL